ncbi:MAG TPA: DUF2510 domain-containing protein [Solirubrobacterales bacterium]|nr:DUF2510 domain-containing protein [Solirubrobacterales bacterium]
MNSTDTPGGSGIPAGWYDDPSGEGLRWWDGERWTEHVHTAESAAAAGTAGSGEGRREGKPPRDLVKLRESIRGRGAKTVGMALGAIVLVIVVIALLVSGGSEDKNAGAGSGSGAPGTTKADTAAARQARIRQIDRRLKNPKLSHAQRKKLQAQKKKLQGGKAAKKAKANQGE